MEMADSKNKDENSSSLKKEYCLDYMGSVSFHRTYATSMSRWLVAWIKRVKSSTYCSSTIDESGIVVKKEEKNLIDFNSGSLSSTDKFNCKHSESTAAFDLSCSSSFSSNDDSSPSVLSNEDSVLCKIPFEYVFEVIMPTDFEKSCVSLVVNQGNDNPLVLHVFRHNDYSVVKEIGDCIKKLLQVHEKSSGLSGQSSKNVTYEDLNSVRFEVMLLGKLQSNELPSQLSFIDEAVKMYLSLESEHAAAKEEMVQKLAHNTSEVPIIDGSLSHQSHSICRNLMDEPRGGTEELIRKRLQDRRQSFDEVRQQRCNSIDISSAAAARRRTGRVRHCSEPSTMGFDKNKTRIFQVGKQSVTLISPDHSARNLQIPFSIIARCSKGVKDHKHFGIFINDSPNRYTTVPKQKDDLKFKCFLFRCSEDYVCDEIMQAIKQACTTSGQGPDPLLAYHTLCKHISITSGGTCEMNKVEKGTNLAKKCIAEVFTEAEQKRFKLKIEEACSDQPQSKYDKLVIFMEMIRQIFEERQIEHDIRIKQLRDPQAPNAVSKRLTFFKSRAKKSLNSFESLWGKGLQKMQELQHDAENHIQSPVERFRFFADNARSAPNTPAADHNAKSSYSYSRVRHHSESPASVCSEMNPLDCKGELLTGATRPRSNTLGSPSQGSINVRRKLNMLTSNYDGSVESLEKRSSVESSSIASSPSTSISKISPEKFFSPEKKLTVRQKIFITVTTPRSQKASCSSCKSPGVRPNLSSFSPIRTPEQVRMAWRRAIQDQIILNKIEKLSLISEDQSILTDPLRDKLNYEDVKKCQPDMCSVWEDLLETDNRERYKMDADILLAAIKKGVPSRLRGKVWTLLYEQWKLRQQNNQSAFRIRVSSYHSLLKELTTHQHAILIDLGRTFPTHPYFSKQLCDGQLALFNLLKAYSLADEQVGYCQGLSFVAGVLIMHSSTTDEAYVMLCHLMAGMNCRKLYLPDMAALRVAVYQLSRLLHDFHSDLYSHLEEHEVTLMLFVTPWFLTMFASILSLGFTARIFDLLFLEGLPALFKTALCFLSHHKQNLLKENGFENIVAYIKDNLPKMNEKEAQEILNQIFELDIGDKLLVYEAEYAVLEDEGIASSEMESDLGNAANELELKFARLQQAHQTVTKYNLDLVEQLEAARMQINSLQQGLAEMAVMDEKRTLQLEQVRLENDILKRK